MTDAIMKFLKGFGGFIINLFKKPVFWLCTAIAVLAVVCSIQHKSIVQKENERVRLEDNQSALLGDIEKYRTENGELAASVQTLTMKSEELGALLPKYEKEIKSLKIELKNAKNMAHVETLTSVEVVAPLEPSAADSTRTEGAPESPEKPFVPREFSWSDEWIDIVGKVYADSVQCSFSSRDSLLLIAHYQKRKCIFGKGKKGKLIKYDVRTKNPHTDIKGVEYIEVVE